MSQPKDYDQSERKSRVYKSGFNVVVGSVLIVVVLVGVYWLAGKSNMRLDLTRNSMYSLSDSSRSLLKKLEDRVTVTVYATEDNIPPEWTQRRDELRELLTEYRNVSNGRVQFTFRDVSPGSDSPSEKAAQEAGMEASLMQQSSASEYKLNKGYFGMTAEYRGKGETISFLDTSQSLEYQLSRVINKAAVVNIPAIGLVAPGGNPLMGQPSQFAGLKSQLEAEGFSVSELQATALGDLASLQMLMIIDPQDLSEESLFHIDQYVMNGGKLFVAAPGVQLNSRGGMNSVIPNPPNINSILEYYGLRINADLVEDWTGGRSQGAMTRAGTIIRYKDPLVFITAKGAKESALTKDIPEVMFAYTSSVSRSDRGTSAPVTALLTSSENSRLQAGPFTLDPTELKPPAPEEKTKAQDLAMLVKGSLTSRYAETPAPVLTNEDGTTKTVAADDIMKKSKESAEVVVVGSALLLVDQAIQAMPANALLPLNVAEAFTRGGDLLALRARDMGTAQLRQITPAEARWTQALIIIGIPLLLVAFGFGLLMNNRRRRARYRRIYGNAA